jgi:acyl transferase domain-containing protein
VFGGQEQPIYIGSVKPNLGHSEGASGVSSIIKSVLALEHRTIPPNVHFTTPNPKIPFAEANLTVPVEPVPWPKSRKERISVNSFGIGGANGHVILDSAAEFGLKAANGQHFANERGITNGNTIINGHGMIDGHATTNGHHHEVANGNTAQNQHLLVFSAHHASSLQRSLIEYQHYIQGHPDRLPELAYTLSCRRSHHPHRAFCVTDGSEPLEFSPLAKSKKSPELTFVFTGQGAQWAQMGKELIQDYPDFSADIEHMDGVLSNLLNSAGWSIKEELLKDAAASQLSRAEFSQPLCTAVQVALVNLIRSWGVKPAGVVGHSSGEIAAAYAANAITTDEAIIIAYYRGQVTKSGKRKGGMAAVGIGRDTITPYLVDGVGVACENSGSSVTLSGDEDVLDNILQRIKQELPDVFVRRLKVEMAYHSREYFSLDNAFLISYLRVATVHSNALA